MSTAEQITTKPESAEDVLRKERERVISEAPKFIRCKSKKGTKLLKAAVVGDEKIVVHLLAHKGIDINCTDIDRGETPLHYASSAGHRSVVDYLLAKGANANAVNFKGHVPVHKAVYYDYVDIVKTLGQYEADLNVQDAEGISPLHLSLKREHQNSFITLIECGAELKLGGPLPSGLSNSNHLLFEAASKGFTKGVALVVMRATSLNLDSQNTSGNTALHVAAANGRTGVIAALLGFKPDVTVKNNGGFTAADLAAANGYQEIASILKKSHEFAPVIEDTYKAPAARAKAKKSAIFKSADNSLKGYLYILVSKKWKQTWLELRDGILYEFDKQGGRQIALTNLFGVKIKEYKKERSPFCFQITTPANISFIMKADTNEDYQQWMQLLKKQDLRTKLRESMPANTDSKDAQDYHILLNQAAIVGDSWMQIEEKLRSHYTDENIQKEWTALEEREMDKKLEILCSDAMEDFNMVKNRYINILPFNSTRVRLCTSDAVAGDYVNANYVHCGHRWYIACQAPLPTTFEDFYRMLWENNCSIIVMLTKLEETGRLKAHNYLPQEGPAQVGDMIVEIVSEEIPSEYFVVKKLRLWLGTNAKDITHYQFCGWPDHGVPDRDSIMEMIEVVRKATKSDNNPIAVHCSAGVGRTGTWIAINALLEDLDNAVTYGTVPTLNIMNLLDYLRSQRGGMLTHIDQYEFCYRALLSKIQSMEKPKLVKKAVSRMVDPKNIPLFKSAYTREIEETPIQGLLSHSSPALPIEDPHHQHIQRDSPMTQSEGGLRKPYATIPEFVTSVANTNLNVPPLLGFPARVPPALTEIPLPPLDEVEPPVESLEAHIGNGAAKQIRGAPRNSPESFFHKNGNSLENSLNRNASHSSVRTSTTETAEVDEPSLKRSFSSPNTQKLTKSPYAVIPSGDESAPRSPYSKMPSPTVTAHQDQTSKYLSQTLSESKPRERPYNPYGAVPQSSPQGNATISKATGIQRTNSRQ
eukprot:TRINITY_DN5977_c0_g1_i2.p1 TRINITY_DN5977_c0_g1~~TRINITY_DN5977_c0_g1_i2.p1  ORF type:complete len:983 (+),score=271.06 TRINITY_DN5977_c0_g1_i2:60-3008(+)